ncbi:MAG: hypothetical protein OXF52_02745 [Candidatus Dadabacteria bacterium]|nr:hypothetical protein [Candidatus Dadabacteria bacterium]
MKIDLKNLLSNPDFPKKEKVLLILYGIDKEIAIKDIVKTAVSEGLPEAKNWNISHMLSLSRTQGLTTKLPGGWIITQKGIKTLKEKKSYQQHSDPRDKLRIKRIRIANYK